MRIGQLDYTGRLPSCLSVAAKDSFAYVTWDSVPQFRSVDVSDARNPVLAGGCDVFNRPQDMVLRDSFVYVAEGRRFQVVNVARPREPVLVGSCGIQDGVFGLVVQDTLAYVAGVSLEIVDVANPASPYVVSSGGRPSIGVAVSDTFAYVPSFDTLFVYSVANPVQPRILSTTPTGRSWDVVLGDSVLFIGTSDGVEAYDVRNPAEPRRIGAASAPYSNRRLCYADGYLYSALWEAGVAVYETTTTGIAERGPAVQPNPSWLRAAPNPTSGRVKLVGAASTSRVTAYDATGRALAIEVSTGEGGDVELNAAGLKPGVYFVEVLEDKRIGVLRLVKP